MQKKIVVSFLLTLTQLCFAQYNYVPNPGFEEHSACPTAFSQIERCIGWRGATAGTSDYLFDCNNGSDVDLPVSYMGNQEPHGGKGYAGIIIYSQGNGSEDYKEYLEVTLKNPLLAQMPYKVSFYCSLADYVSTFASEDLGAILSPGNLGYDLQFNSITQVPPPIKLDGMIQNTTSWVKVEGTYTAQGGETHLTIGSFIKSSEMDVLYLNPGGEGFAYYFIDDVSVTVDIDSPLFGDEYGNGYDPLNPSDNAYYKDGCLYDVIIPNVFTPEGDGINEDYFIKYIGYIKSDIVIVDRWGKTVFTSDNFFVDYWNGLDHQHGVYFYQLNMMKQDGQYDSFTGGIQIIGN